MFNTNEDALAELFLEKHPTIAAAADRTAIRDWITATYGPRSKSMSDLLYTNTVKGLRALGITIFSREPEPEVKPEEPVAEVVKAQPEPQHKWQPPTPKLSGMLKGVKK